ncbi:hypothetical protein AAK967_03985 [Atopobiaceae bacterium 24-176]
MLREAACTKVEADLVRSQWWFAEMRPYAKALAGLPPSADPPVRLLSTEKNRHGRTSFVAPHRIPPRLPEAPLLRVVDPAKEEPVYAVSPSLYLLMRAPLLGDVALARMVSDLCGSYVYRPDQNGEIARRPRSLATVEGLRRELLDLKGEHGAGRAISVLGFSASGAASPMETAVALVMCAPRAMGGRAFPAPHLNEPVSLDPDERKLLGRSAMRFDFFWPEARTAVEYDSARFHNNEQQDELDKLRREVAANHGVELMSLTRSVLRDPVRLDLFMEQVARRLDVGFDWSERHLAARRSLRNQVLCTHLVW